ncbi:Rid family detoxifying hydrolase [Allorhizobium borbori]|uniref:2-iminobutanoate/2-iminopropanoate deaminase n=1 Tax=Allorhizobium borbori TaxID=485907 RepID=A0A7W6P1J5_9HYPH|nr:Rid family detoxifying hydrolase [Allorhizobium borbori]MBB4104464.1 2-iminobutanoate/2-iminopropanoate deaminase [Allorhizobium borbori]
MQPITTTDAPAAIGPYSQGIIANGLLFISGQLPIDPATGAFISNDPVDQCRQSLRNIEAIAKAAGADLSKVVKTTVLLKDLGSFAAVNAAYAEFFPNVAPARTTFEAAALPKGALVEIDAIVSL